MMDINARLESDSGNVDRHIRTDDDALTAAYDGYVAARALHRAIAQRCMENGDWDLFSLHITADDILALRGPQELVSPRW